MWHLIPTFLYIAYAQAYQLGPNSPYSLPHNDRSNVARSYLSYGSVGIQAPYNAPVAAPAPYRLYGSSRSEYVDDLYVPKASLLGYYVRSNSNLRQPQSQQKNLYQVPEVYFDNGADRHVDLRNPLDTPSYFDDLELTENFGNYLKRRTQIDTLTSSLNDAAHQYNALLTVLVALAKVIRNSCAEFDQTYEEVYLPTVETYYKIGLANADKVGVMIEDYVRKGNSNMPKLRKLKEDTCEKELFCSAIIDQKIKSSPLVYVKELESLQAIAHLARSYYNYAEEFNEAAQKGTVLPYLQKSKDRLREYILHAVNSVEHLTDTSVTCK